MSRGGNGKGIDRQGLDGTCDVLWHLVMRGDTVASDYKDPDIQCVFRPVLVAINGSTHFECARRVPVQASVAEKAYKI